MKRQNHVSIWMAAAAFLSLLTLAPVLASPAGSGTSASPGPFYALSQFGPVDTPESAQATLDRGADLVISAGGGVIVIPPGAPANWKPRNDTQGIWLNPPAPAQTSSWGKGPGVTLLDYRDGTVRVTLPQVTGMEIFRTLKLPEGQSLPHWDYQPMLRFHNAVLRGSNSYRDWLQEDVQTGASRRFYVRTVRGLFPGLFLNTGDYSNIQRLYVQDLGYDREKGSWYFTADATADVPKGTILHNKNHTNVIRMDTYSHNENQTFDVMLWRHNYSQGDNYMFDARFYYMGDVHSAAGDENGVVYAAFVESEVNGFRARVTGWNPQTSELVFTDPVKADTLGSGRPIINRNPAKAITTGFVWIVAPATWTGPTPAHLSDPVFQGRSYPTTIQPNNIGHPSLRMGGLIRFPENAPVGPEVVGRYFAVNEESERVPGGSGILRWYLIDSFRRNPDGTQDIEIIRHWWGAKAAGAPTLYHPDNYSRDGHEKPLAYIIAPGVTVYDVADAVESHQVNTAGSPRILRLAPSPFAGTPVDFAPGDPIEQAIGPDPFKPIPFRSWVWDSVPGVFPAPIFDVANNGAVARHAVMTVAGGSPNLADSAKRKDSQPPWENLFVFASACNNGIVFGADVAGAALLFEQPNDRPQPIAWRYDAGRKTATLSVSPENGTMTFDGGGLVVPGGLTAVSGLSGTKTPAKNLRGIAVPVPAGVRQVVVPFPHREADANYAIFVQPNWLTAHAVSGRTESGFTVEFAQPSASGAHLHWMLVR